MSQQQTVRITTTETSHGSALIINTGYLATPPGILKLLQFVNILKMSKLVTQKKCLAYFLIIKSNRSFSSLFFSRVHVYLYTTTGYKQLLGIVCVGIIAYHYNDHGYPTYSSEIFFYLMTVTFLICTTILLISCLFSWSTGGIISKTIYVSNQIHSRVGRFYQCSIRMTNVFFLFSFR